MLLSHCGLSFALYSQNGVVITSCDDVNEPIEEHHLVLLASILGDDFQNKIFRAKTFCFQTRLRFNYVTDVERITDLCKECWNGKNCGHYPNYEQSFAAFTVRNKVLDKSSA